MVYLIIVIIFWILILYGMHELYEQLKSINNKLLQLLENEEKENEEI